MSINTSLQKMISPLENYSDFLLTTASVCVNGVYWSPHVGGHDRIIAGKKLRGMEISRERERSSWCDNDQAADTLGWLGSFADFLLPPS